MFYVNSIEGPQFRGTMEALEQSRRAEKIRAAKQTRFEDHQWSGTERTALTNAASAYQKMINRENMIEPLVHIYQIMSTPASTIDPFISIIDAWKRLRKEEIRQLLVVNEKQEVVGMLSDRDILQYLNVIDGQISVESDLSAADVIAREVVSTDSMSDIRRVARVMAFFHLDAMPVLQDGRLSGIVTRGDILRGFAENPKLNLWA